MPLVRLVCAQAAAPGLGLILKNQKPAWWPSTSGSTAGRGCRRIKHLLEVLLHENWDGAAELLSRVHTRRASGEASSHLCELPWDPSRERFLFLLRLKALLETNGDGRLTAARHIGPLFAAYLVVVILLPHAESVRLPIVSCVPHCSVRQVTRGCKGMGSKEKPDDYILTDMAFLKCDHSCAPEVSPPRPSLRSQHNFLSPNGFRRTKCWEFSSARQCQ